MRNEESVGIRFLRHALCFLSFHLTKVTRKPWLRRLGSGRLRFPACSSRLHRRERIETIETIETRASVVLPGCARPSRWGPGFFISLQIKNLCRYFGHKVGGRALSGSSAFKADLRHGRHSPSFRAPSVHGEGCPDWRISSRYRCAGWPQTYHRADLEKCSGKWNRRNGRRKDGSGQETLPEPANSGQ